MIPRRQLIYAPTPVDWCLTPGGVEFFHSPLFKRATCSTPSGPWLLFVGALAVSEDMDLEGPSIMNVGHLHDFAEGLRWVQGFAPVAPMC